MSSYYRFRPDLFTTQFNFEHTAAVISEDDSSLVLHGTFRTSGDLAALIWNTEDIIKHDYCKYKYDNDYSGVKLKFKINYTGDLAKFDNVELKPSLSIESDEGRHFYVPLGLCSTTSAGETNFIVTDGEIYLNHKWIKHNSLLIKYEGIDADGNYITGTGEEGIDYKIDYIKGRYFIANGNIPYGASIMATYNYSNFNAFEIDFDNLYTSEHPSDSERVNPNGIKKILIPLIPNDYTRENLLMYGKNNKEYSLEIYDMVTINGFLNKENTDMDIHEYRIAEGYDDEYDKCPRRLAREMRKLGYSKIIDLYIGASHFYEKYGVKGKVSTGHKDMILDRDKGLTYAFKKWYKSYLNHLKNNDVDEVVLSISMENLQMPYEWKQLMFDGNPGGTGWIPATAFYSPTNIEAREWISSIARECLDILVNSNLKPILQWGEPWWWWQEFVPEDVSTPYPNQPPCFYDQATKDKFKKEFGYEIPIFDRTSNILVGDKEVKFLKWLNLQLQEYSEFMRKIAKSYENGEYTVLYFPPSIIDIERVPYIIQKVNTPFPAWDKGQLDFIQIEDYDWVVTANKYHEDIYDFGKDILNYDVDKQHYFSGFVMKPENSEKEWRLIEIAAKQAKGCGIKEVFIWAGTQVRRDGFVINNSITGRSFNWSNINIIEN